MSSAPDPSTPSPWLHHAADAAALRNGRRLAWALLFAFALVTWFGVRHGIGSSWRECDTQSIARNFLLDDFDPLRPRVDWRGDTDGAVECEFPLYQMAIAAVLRLIGDVDAEWPGRLLALLSLLWAGYGVHRLAEWRNGPNAALAALIAFLCTGGAWLLATRVVPDATSLALTVNGILVFAHYLASGSRLALLLAGTMVTLAGLQKPLALQAGLVMFGWTLVLARRRLADPLLWLVLLGAPAVVAAWLVHGAHLHAETGLSFGVVSGGDTKFPGLGQLLDPAIYGKLAVTTAKFGFSVLAMLGLLVALVRRRFDRSDLVLLLAMLAGLMVSLRYSHTEDLGPQYHAFAASVGAWFVARAWPERPTRLDRLAMLGFWLNWFVVLVAAAAQAAFAARNERGVRNVVNELPIVAVAHEARAAIEPGALIIARSAKPRFDSAWARNQNCEDPRFFYLARARGWVLAREEFTADRLAYLHRAGARYVYDPLPEENEPAAAAWLQENAERLVARDGGGVFYRLRPRD
jgi:hypothetical protein